MSLILDSMAVRAADGQLVDKTEYYNSFSRRSHDLFGFVDYIALDRGIVTFVQVTSASNGSARKKKIEKILEQPAFLSHFDGRENIYISVETWDTDKTQRPYAYKLVRQSYIGEGKNKGLWNRGAERTYSKKQLDELRKAFRESRQRPKEEGE